jgi:hypothetical protein
VCVNLPWSFRYKKLKKNSEQNHAALIQMALIQIAHPAVFQPLVWFVACVVRRPDSELSLGFYHLYTIVIVQVITHMLWLGACIVGEPSVSWFRSLCPYAL